MIDLDSLHAWVSSIIGGWLCWAGYVTKQLKDRPTREELLLRLENIEDKIDNIKEDVQEIKHEQQRIDYRDYNGS